jgi:hypothetical protein
MDAVLSMACQPPPDSLEDVDVWTMGEEQSTYEVVEVQIKHRAFREVGAVQASCPQLPSFV